MSRTVSQTLLDAIENQQGETILRVKTWLDLAAYNAAPNTPEQTWQTNKFKIEGTEAEAALISETNDYTVSDFTVFLIERGVSISGVEYVTQSGLYFVSKFEEKAGRINVSGSSFPDQKIIISGDDTYQNVITSFCTEIGKTAVFKDTGAAWLSYQFLPAGKQVILNKAERFLNLIRQKYLIQCYERSPKELVFYHATTEQSAWKDIIFADGQLVLVASSGSNHTAQSVNGIAYTKNTAPMFTNAITYSESLDIFLAVGNGFGIHSGDGANWTQSNFIETNEWLDVIWSNIANKFITIAENARSTSSDGDTWVTAFSGVGAKTIAESDNEIIILGTTNCLRSTDGASYSSAALSGSYNKVIFANGLFVAVGVSACATSPDGITWTARTIPAGTYTALAYSPTLDLFLAIGSNLAATSPDGITWTSRTAPANQAWTAVTWADDLAQFIAVSSDGDNRIASSTDGINWQILTAQADFSLSYLDGPTSSIIHGTNTVHYISRDETASVNTEGDTSYPAWNLGYLESTASAPATNTDPFYKFFLQKAPLRLDITDGDRIHFEPSWVLDPTLPIDAMTTIIEIFDSKASPAWYQEIRSLALFDSVEGGSLPSTIERVAAYTPLVSSGFDGNLTPSVNNLQSLAEAVDNLTISGGTPPPATTAINDFQVGDGAGAWIKKTLAQTVTIIRTVLDSIYSDTSHTHGSTLVTDIQTATLKNPPADADSFPINDVAGGNVLKRVSMTVARAYMKTLFDTLYAAIAHASTHQSGGADAIKLDDLAAPDDNTDLDASTTKHGLLKKLSNVASEFISGTGAWTRLISAVQGLYTHGNNAGVPASTTYYLAYYTPGLFTTTANIAVTRACTAQNLYFSTNSAQPASGSLVVTLLKNNSATALTITIAAGAAAAQHSDLAHTVSFAAGDTATLQIVNNATGTSALITRSSLELLY